MQMIPPNWNETFRSEFVAARAVLCGLVLQGAVSEL